VEADKRKMPEQEKQNKESEKAREDRIVRIMQKDIEGKSSVYAGLAKIKGVSWSLSNAVCKKLNLPKNKKVGTLTPEEIDKIEKFLKNPDLPSFLNNRQKDLETGKDRHLTGTDLELRKDFDIKRLKKIKSYRGLRHMVGLPMRGQRTKSNFRRNRAKGSGIKKKNKTQ
jgi:small subunit ribosomal protein S13